MQTIIQKYRTLSERLASATLDGKLQWSIHPFTDELYCDLGKYKVVLSEAESADGSPLIQVRVKDSDDNQIDFFTDETVAGTAPLIARYKDYWLLLSDVYNLARRSAVGADQALDEVIGSLPPLKDDDIPF